MTKSEKKFQSHLLKLNWNHTYSSQTPSVTTNLFITPTVHLPSQSTVLQDFLDLFCYYIMVIICEREAAQKHLRVWIECTRPASWPLWWKQEQWIVPTSCFKTRKPNCSTKAKKTNPIGHRIKHRKPNSFFLKVIYTLFHLACSIDPSTTKNISNGTDISMTI